MDQKDFMDRFFIEAEEEEEDTGEEVAHAEGRFLLRDPPGRSSEDEGGSMDGSWHSFWTRRGLTASSQTSPASSPSGASMRRLRSTAHGQDLLVARAALNCSLLQQHVDAAASVDGDFERNSCSTPRSSVASGRVSPIRGLRPENAMAETTRGIQRSMAIIGIGLACFATAARVPKLTRMDIDVDWSRQLGVGEGRSMMGGGGSSSRLGFSSGFPTTTPAENVAARRQEKFLCESSSVRCAAAILTASSSSSASDSSSSCSSTNNMRLRGGEETPHFTPSASSCDLRRQSGMGASSSKSCLCGDSPFSQGPTPERAQNMARGNVPKLSRTVDLH
jgi:hypothetical protein